MFPRTLSKLIDEAVVPALLVVGGKFFSTLILSRFLGIPLLELKSLAYRDPQKFLFINSYSNLVVFLGVGLGPSWILARALFFHKTHLTPWVTTHLSHFHLTSLVGTTFELFHRAIVWLSYCWLLTFLFLVQGSYKLCFPWLGWVAGGLTLLFTLVLALDMAREIKISS